MRGDVVVLYVDTRGVYPSLVSEWYDEILDARCYPGPWPVVAHPPCNLWTNFAALNYARYGGEHNRPGNDGGKFKHALKMVRRYGGVLEHPAYSNAWDAFGLQRPKGIGWNRVSSTEWVCEVWQSAYGHKARKRTWLYYSGFNKPLEAKWSRVPGTHQIGWFDRNKPSLSKRNAHLTPPAFASWLVNLAGHAMLNQPTWLTS